MLFKYCNYKAAQENRLPVLAVDLDGTLLESAEPPFIGVPIKGMKEELETLRKSGWLISVWTVRSDVDDIRSYLNKYNIPFDFINENPYGPPDGSVKIFADVYLDDRAINFNGDANGLADKVLYFKPWYET